MKMSDKDLYEVLEVSPNASEEVIKNAYRALAKKWHPDTYPDNMKKEVEIKFEEINLAYEILSESEKRAEYDKSYSGKSSKSTKYHEDVTSTNNSSGSPPSESSERSNMKGKDSPNLQSTVAKFIRNKKTLIAVIFLLVPASIYGLLYFENPDTTTQPSSANEVKTDSAKAYGTNPTANQTETVKKHEAQTSNQQQGEVEVKNGIESFNSQISAIKSEGFTPLENNPSAQVADGFGNTLYAWVAYATGSATGSGQQVFFYRG